MMKNLKPVETTSKKLYGTTENHHKTIVFPLSSNLNQICHKGSLCHAGNNFDLRFFSFCRFKILEKKLAKNQIVGMLGVNHRSHFYYVIM